MWQVLASAWALLLGLGLLMVGNGLQGTLMGVRGEIEGFTTAQLSVITSAYFLGFLGGSNITPKLIRNVGHVRVFAALASFISAALILFPLLTDPWSWSILRVIIGFGFSGVFITTESWLNAAASNDNRGKALSLYMIVQMSGIVASQILFNFGDPAGFGLFILPSVLISLAFGPILLSAVPVPAFENARPMSLVKLFRTSPTGLVGMVILGGLFAAQFGMASVYASAADFTVVQVTAFIASIFLAAMVAQYPIGLLSDRADRRLVILMASAAGAVAALLGWAAESNFVVILAAGFGVGAVTNPLYSLLIAYTNDFLERDEMAAASAGLIFANGLGAVTGPLLTGWFMTIYGPEGFWSYQAILLITLSGYITFRMTRRPSTYDEEQEAVAYAPVPATASVVAVGAAQEYYAENAENAEASEDTEPPSQAGA